VVIYEAFVEGKLEAPKHLARTVHDLYFEPKYEEFRSRTIWSLSNAARVTHSLSMRGPLDHLRELHSKDRLTGVWKFRFIPTWVSLESARFRRNQYEL
jgi:hypothetical protein